MRNVVELRRKLDKLHAYMLDASFTHDEEQSFAAKVTDMLTLVTELLEAQSPAPPPHVHHWVIFDELADQEQCTICKGYMMREWDPERTRKRLEREQAQRESEARGDGSHA